MRSIAVRHFSRRRRLISRGPKVSERQPRAPKRTSLANPFPMYNYGGPACSQLHFGSRRTAEILVFASVFVPSNTSVVDRKRHCSAGGASRKLILFLRSCLFQNAIVNVLRLGSFARFQNDCRSWTSTERAGHRNVPAPPNTSLPRALSRRRSSQHSRLLARCAGLRGNDMLCLQADIL